MRDTRRESLDTKLYQNHINSFETPEQLETEMQTQIKRLNGALLCNSEKHLKGISEKIVLVNRKIQKHKK